MDLPGAEDDIGEVLVAIQAESSARREHDYAVNDFDRAFEQSLDKFICQFVSRARPTIKHDEDLKAYFAGIQDVIADSVNQDYGTAETAVLMDFLSSSSQLSGFGVTADAVTDPTSSFVLEQAMDRQLKEFRKSFSQSSRTAVMFGSRVTGLALGGSDVDVCMAFPELEKIKAATLRKRLIVARLNRLRRKLKERGYKGPSEIVKARVPLLKIRLRQMDFDFSVESRDAILKTHYQRVLMELHTNDNARCFVLAVKAFAKTWDMVNPLGPCWNGYGWELLAIHYLTGIVRPEVLPPLAGLLTAMPSVNLDVREGSLHSCSGSRLRQYLSDLRRRMAGTVFALESLSRLRNSAVAKIDLAASTLAACKIDGPSRGSFQYEDSNSTGRLFYGFCVFMASFSCESSVFDPRSGLTFRRKPLKSAPIVLIDPFTDENVCRYCSPEGIMRVRGQFDKALVSMDAGKFGKVFGRQKV